jgi:hypothetical protein
MAFCIWMNTHTDTHSSGAVTYASKLAALRKECVANHAEKLRRRVGLKKPEPLSFERRARRPTRAECFYNDHEVIERCVRIAFAGGQTPDATVRHKRLLGPTLQLESNQPFSTENAKRAECRGELRYIRVDDDGTCQDC